MSSLNRLGLSSALTALFIPALAFTMGFTWPFILGLSALFLVGVYLGSYLIFGQTVDPTLVQMKDKVFELTRDIDDFKELLLQTMQKYPSDYQAELKALSKDLWFTPSGSNHVLHGMMLLSNSLTETTRLLKNKPKLLYGNERIFVLLPLAQNLLTKLAQHDIQKLSPEIRSKAEDGIKLLIHASQNLFLSSQSAHEKDIAIEISVLENTLQLM